MPKPGQTADAAIMEITNKILEKAADARSCYAAAHELNDDVRFAEMLLVDGCFILELLYRRKVNHPGNNDPISCTNGLIGHAVTDDLLLLENQIPMFVLQTLLDFSLVQPYTLPDLIISFFGNMLNFELEIEKVDRTESAAHILGLLHDCYRRRDTAASGGRSISHITKHSAIDLVRAGVRFREDKGRDQICMSFSTSCRFSLLSGSGCNSWFFQFCGRTSFEIPKLHIYDSTESLLRNLIAWEQFSPSMSKTITSYAFLMDTLVNSNDDVEVLEKAGVLQNHLGASEDAKRLFNSICKEVDVGPFIFSEEWQKVEEYRKLKWPRYLASLRRDYFNSPWALISVIAALIIFVLTFIQTVSAILKP
ncbi:hypothetical protein RJ640_018369 [Escallonia rubra]|uniref:Uncharacterized protein n=1 Tax=Escallonia rubra TaxID=112253 RepID=A0AA88S3F0_9ASTE|nr:hypothetical protein RJ640_018369 [Escallonia rubra]